jgi:putative polyketide hydroxylase
MTDREDRVPVLIVGAGGAGLSLSLLLRQQEIASLLIERRPDVSWYPRARNLNFRTLEVFRGLGLEAQVLAAGSHFSRMFGRQTLVSHEQVTFPSVDQALHIVDHPEILTPEPLFWYCPQSRLEPLLLAEAKLRGCVLRYNTELISFTQDAQGVRATIRDRATAASTVVQANYLLGADGAHSHIRAALGVKADGLGVLDEHYIFIYFRAAWGELIRGYEKDAILIDRPDVRGIFLITDADRGMFAIQEETVRNYSVERCKELVLNAIGKPDLAVEIVDVVHWQPSQLVAERFGEGRVFLVGDAAHTMPPKLGLGVNTAIQSAQNLAWKLAAVLKGQAPQVLLETYQAERYPVGLLASQQSLVGPAASLLTKGDDDKLLPSEKRISLFSLIAGYRYRSQAVLSEDTTSSGPSEIELLSQPEELTGEPGTRVPHLWFERQGSRISSLDLLDGRFVLLAGADGTAWCKGISAAAEKLGISVAAFRVAVDLIDTENQWQAKMGVSTDGAILLRPDGFVAWRSRAVTADPASSLVKVLSQVLCRSNPEAQST